MNKIIKEVLLSIILIFLMIITIPFTKVYATEQINPNDNFIISSNGYTLEKYTGSSSVVELPDGIRSVGEEAFKGNTSIKEVILNNDCNIIGISAFEGCSSLETITAYCNDEVHIADYAFKDCSSLTNINIAHVFFVGNCIFKNCISLVDFKPSIDCRYFPEGCFYGCTNLQGIDLSNIVFIESYAFYNCSNLSKIVFDNTLEKVGRYAFYGCNTLKSINIPNSITSMGSYIFADCLSLEEVYLDCKIDHHNVYNYNEFKELFNGCTALSKVEFGENTNNIYEGMFRNCTNLKKIVFPKTVEYIGPFVFEGSGIETITFENDNVAITARLLSQNVIDKKKILIKGNKGSAAEGFAYMYGQSFETLDGLYKRDYYEEPEVGCYEATKSAYEASVEYLNEYYIEKYPDMAFEYEFGTDKDRDFFKQLTQDIIEANPEKTAPVALYDWMNDNIFKAGYRTYFYPMDVYRTKSADCNGNAELLCELFRCAEIPAVVANGFVGNMKETVSFRDFVSKTDINLVPHAWVYYYWDGKWQVADSGMNMLLSDEAEICSYYYTTNVDRNCIFHPYFSPCVGFNECGSLYINGRFFMYGEGDILKEYGKNSLGMDDWGAYVVKNRLCNMENQEISSETFGNEGWKYKSKLKYYLKNNTYTMNSSIININNQRFYFTNQDGYGYKIVDNENWGLFGGIPYIRVGQTIKLEPQVIDSISDYTVKWSESKSNEYNSNLGEFIINEDGSLTCVKAGSFGFDVSIIDSNGSLIYSLNLSVFGYEPIKEINIAEVTDSITICDEYIVNIIEAPENCYLIPYVLTSSNTNIAEILYVGNDIVIRPKSYGTTTVSITAADGSGVSKDITVNVNYCSEEGHKEVTDEAVAPTCTTAGLTEGKHCSVCNEVLVAQKEISATGHTEVVDKAVAATCTTTGLTEGKHCSVCKEVIVAQKTVDKKGHSYVTTTTKATTTKNGSVVKKCNACGHVDSSKVIAYPKTVTLAKTSYTYDGKAHKPKVTVKDASGNVIDSSNYTVEYADGCKNAGKYTATITFKGNYTGTVTKSFTIKKAKNGLIVKPTTKTIKYSAVKKKAQKLKLTVAKNNGKISYKTSSKKLTVAKDTVTIKKGTKKGTYKVTITAKGDANYEGVSKTITIRIK